MPNDSVSIPVFDLLPRFPYVAQLLAPALNGDVNAFKTQYLSQKWPALVKKHFVINFMLHNQKRSFNQDKFQILLFLTENNFSLSCLLQREFITRFSCHQLAMLFPADDINVYLSSGDDPLLAAVTSPNHMDSVEKIQFLFKKGANPTVSYNSVLHFGGTMLHIAIANEGFNSNQPHAIALC